ncbi:MAG: hypothetical protein KC502_13080 [Myxococcales bacterium]|nr:hypothetical protein [Myxococcales bacterium]
MTTPIMLLIAIALAGCSSAGQAKPPQNDAVDGVTADSSPADAVAGDAMASDASVDSLDLGDAAQSHQSPLPCTSWGAPVETGQVKELNELSGLALSHQGWLWAHNDSGEKTGRLLLLDTTGQPRAELTLPGVTPVDWEDIAAGPCGPSPSPKRCLWVGDIGDNGHKRKGVAILRIEEPTTLPAAATLSHWVAKVGTVTEFHFNYGKEGDNPHRPDAEALAVLSDGRLIVATKRDDGSSRLYRVTPGAKEANAELLGTLDVSDPPLTSGLSLRVTAADLVTDSRLVVRTYYRAWVVDFSLPLTAPAAELGDVISAAKRTGLKTGFDVQGEAMTRDGSGGFWHTSELASQPLWRIPCATRK